MEMEDGMKLPVSGVDSSVDTLQQDTTFAFKLLFCPSGKIPTQMSGTIVYATTAVICE